MEYQIGAHQLKRNLCVLLAILSIKAVLLFVDPKPAYFLGDSEAYLATATIKYIPLDRSVMYGLLIRRIALRAHSLELMIVLQVVFSAVAAWLLFVALRKVFRAPFWLAVAFGVLCAVEPLQLLSERYVLTEACTNFLFALHLVLALTYTRRGRIWALLSAQAAGVLLIGFRISFLPLVLIDSVLVPLLSPEAVGVLRSIKLKSPRFGLISSRRVALVALYLGLSLAISQGLLARYKVWYGKQASREPAVFYRDGAFLVTDFAPLIDPEDFPLPAKRDAIFSKLQFDRRDPSTRPAQHFLPGGLWPNIANEFQDPKQANDLARQTAIHAVLRQPFSELRLSTRMFVEYFDPADLRWWLVKDEGGEADSEMSNETKGWLQHLYGVSDTTQYQMSLTKRWHLFAMPWYWLILCSLVLSPLVLLVRPAMDRPQMILCTTAALLFLAGVTVTIDRPTPRFLTSPAWIVLLLLGIVFSFAKSSLPVTDNAAETRDDSLIGKGSPS
jgi:hypothetical protein